MMYLVLDVQSTEHIEKCSQLNAWVNVASKNEAMNILSEELSLQGWSMTNVIESTTTSVKDYFAPCEALDAYNEAIKSLYALRFIQA